jgi:hypothetical protein
MAKQEAEQVAPIDGARLRDAAAADGDRGRGCCTGRPGARRDRAPGALHGRRGGGGRRRPGRRAPPQQTGTEVGGAAPAGRACAGASTGSSSQSGRRRQTAGHRRWGRRCHRQRGTTAGRRRRAGCGRRELDLDSIWAGCRGTGPRPFLRPTELTRLG